VKAASLATRRLYVLDTNVLMHDPTAIFRFEEHDIYLPMVVLEELDANKKGLSEASRNARQVSRFLDDIMRGVTKEQIDASRHANFPADCRRGCRASARTT
jgi:PhoH-like ATPase